MTIILILLQALTYYNYQTPQLLFDTFLINYLVLLYQSIYELFINKTIRQFND